MARVHFELLGGFSARRDGGQPCSLPTRKAQALLAYLALPAGRFHSREKLTALLWGDAPEAQARQSFRQALAASRRALGEDNPPALLTQGDTIALNPRAVVVDVAELESALAAGSTETLARVAMLYKGDLLDGFGVDEPPFEEWRVVERERLRELALEGLAKLLREQLRADRPEPAIQTALRILAMDPLQEAVHRTFMKLLLRQGRRAAALQQYQVCLGWLQRELGVEPEEETRQLYREILRTTANRTGAGTPTPAAVPLASAGARAAEAPMIGRDTELDRLRAALARMLDTGGSVVLVSGEAGIGKSRLIQEFGVDATARGVRLVAGRCHETEQALPLHPWIEALRGDRLTLDPGLRARLGAATGAELVRVFPELLSSDERPVTLGAQHALLFDALAELIGTQAAEQPMVLIIEDLHWADAMSARFLAYLGRRIHRLPVLIVGSTRPEELVDALVLAQALTELRTDGRVDELPLSALSEEDTRRLAGCLHSGTRGRDWDQIVDDVWSVSEGNPFVVVESIHAVRDQTSDAWMRGSGLARRVQDFVAARLARLAERPRHIVGAAATIGRDFSFTVLARSAGVGEYETAAAVEELVRRRILDTVGERLAFTHDWIRKVAYEGLLPSTRAVLHAAIADALEELHRAHLDDVADQLGHHYSRAGNASKAIHYLVRFAELATQRYALDDAYGAFEHAMTLTKQLSPSDRDRCRLDVALRQAFLLSILGRQHEILELLRTHAGHVDRVDDPVLTSEYYFRLGLTQFFLGDHRQSRHAAEQAVAEGERARNAECIGKALHVLSLTARDAGDVHDGIAAATRGIELVDRPHTQHWRGLLYHDLALNCLGAGLIDAALDAAERADALGRTTQWPRLRALAGYAKAWGLLLRGDDELAVETADRSLEFSRDPMVTGLVRGTLAYAYLERGDARSALGLLSQVVDQLRSSPLRHGEIRYMALLSEAYLLTGDTLRARSTAERALQLSEAAQMPFSMGVTQRALGRIAQVEGKPAETETHFSRALAIFASCSATLEAAQTHMDLAALRAVQGDKHAAHEHLTSALATFEAANTPKRVARARDLGRSLGITVLDA